MRQDLNELYSSATIIATHMHSQKIAPNDYIDGWLSLHNLPPCLYHLSLILRTTVSRVSYRQWPLVCPQVSVPGVPPLLSSVVPRLSSGRCVLLAFSPLVAGPSSILWSVSLVYLLSSGRATGAFQVVKPCCSSWSCCPLCVVLGRRLLSHPSRAADTLRSIFPATDIILGGLTPGRTPGRACAASRHGLCGQ